MSDEVNVPNVPNVPAESAAVSIPPDMSNISGAEAVASLLAMYGSLLL